MHPSDEQTRTAHELARRFNDSWNRQDGPAYASAYWPESELVDPTGTVWDGREAIEQMHVELWHGPGSGTHVEARVRRIRPLSPVLMVVDLDVAVIGFSPPPPGAADADGTVQARLKHVVEKRGDEWKIIASQNTFVAMRPPQ